MRKKGTSISSRYYISSKEDIKNYTKKATRVIRNLNDLIALFTERVQELKGDLKNNDKKRYHGLIQGTLTLNEGLLDYYLSLRKSNLYMGEFNKAIITV